MRFSYIPSLLFSWWPLVAHNPLSGGPTFISNHCDPWLFTSCRHYFMDQWLCYTADMKCCPSTAAVRTLYYIVITPGLFLLISGEHKPKSLIHEGGVTYSRTKLGNCKSFFLVTMSRYFLLERLPRFLYDNIDSLSYLYAHTQYNVCVYVSAVFLFHHK